jgi:hypothetical protein
MANDKSGLKVHCDFGSFYNDAFNGIPVCIVPGNQPLTYVAIESYASESDRTLGDLYPIPDATQLFYEGQKRDGTVDPNSDGHLLIVDKDNKILWEFSYFRKRADGKWRAAQVSKWDLKKNPLGQRPSGWTSSDAAGLPVLPGLITYDELIVRKQINHAIRVTLSSTYGFVPPGSHSTAVGDASVLPMGARLRLKPNADLSESWPDKTQPPPMVWPIFEAMKKYGLIVADNGGPFFITGTPDWRHNSDELAYTGYCFSDMFEVLQLPALQFS